MLRYLLSRREIQAGAAFFFLIVVISILYLKHVERQGASALERTKEAILSREARNATPTTPRNETEPNDLSEPQHEISIAPSPASTGETAVVDIPSDSRGDAETPAVDTAPPLETTTLAPVPARVSPFGLGIFPEIPTDYPDPTVWERIESAAHDPEGGKKLELLIRTRIKLWEQGTETIGASYNDQTNLIYPNIPNVAYVEWAYIDEPDGTRSRYAAVVSGGIGPQYQEYFDRGEVPPGVTVRPYDEAGIDPYTFLDFTYE